MLYFDSWKNTHDQIKGIYEWKRKLWQCCIIEKKMDSSIGQLKENKEKNCIVQLRLKNLKEIKHGIF